MSGNQDTIFARASGAGRAGVAVYRLSGPAAFAITRQLISKQIKERVATLTPLLDPATGEVIDRGLVLLFPAPASFTGEDVAEFHLHGSAAVEAALYEVLGRLGARPAEAGEYTLRALREGKLDLAQAEALADLIDAETQKQKKQALSQLDGRLSAIADGWRAQLLAVFAPLEADIDFPDEGDVPMAVAAKAGPEIAALTAQLQVFLGAAGEAMAIRDGVCIAIIGQPNAGKSSLLNALAGSDIAIVSQTPGTTRDVVEVRLDLGGVPARVADTAGIRLRTNDEIEAEGIRRAQIKSENADIRLLIADPQAPGSADTHRALVKQLRPGDFLVWSKADLAQNHAGGDAVAPPSSDPDIADGVCVVSVSAKTRAGMDGFVQSLAANVSRETSGEPALTRVRHVRAVEAAVAALTRAETMVATDPELAAEDVRMAARSLGAISGAVGVEDVLGEIFSRFCIGK